MSIQWIIFVALVMAIVQGWVVKRWMLRGISYDRFFSVSSALRGSK